MRALRIQIIFILIFIISINFVSASIKTEIEIYKILENNEKSSVNHGELQIVYYLTNGEIYTIGKGKEGFIFKPENLFCWSDCNIYPNYKIYKQVIKEDGQVISVHDTNIINGRLNNITNLFEIYKNEKVGIKNKEETIISYSNEEILSNENDFYVEWDGKLIIGKRELTSSLSVFLAVLD